MAESKKKVIKYCRNTSYRPGNNPRYDYGPLYRDNGNKIDVQKNRMDTMGNKKFFFVKVSRVSDIEKSRVSHKWDFNSGAEKHIIASAKNGIQTILFFSIGHAVQKFMGFAKFILERDEDDPPTTYSIKWLGTNSISHNATRHMINAFDEHRRVGGTRDGLEINYKCAVQLMTAIEAGEVINFMR